MKYPVVEINGIDLFEKYKAVLAERHSVQPPVPKTFYQDVPGADGSADLSTAVSGRITYERRELTMNFQSEHAGLQWTAVLSEMLRQFHGKEGKIIFGEDPGFYYIGRMEVSGYERSRTFGKFTISANVEPFKYEKQSSLEPWLWDSFSFTSGIIRNYGNLVVNGTRTLRVTGREKWVIPDFIVTGTIQLTFEGKTYMLKAGKNKIYSVAMKPGINMLQFDGNGTVSVDYRGGML